MGLNWDVRQAIGSDRRISYTIYIETDLYSQKIGEIIRVIWVRSWRKEVRRDRDSWVLQFCNDTSQEIWLSEARDSAYKTQVGTAIELAWGELWWGSKSTSIVFFWAFHYSGIYLVIPKLIHPPILSPAVCITNQLRVFPVWPNRAETFSPHLSAKVEFGMTWTSWKPCFRCQLLTMYWRGCISPPRALWVSCIVALCG